LHGTGAEAVAAELSASEPFRGAVLAAVGCPEVASQLLSAASVDFLAGRLALNAVGIQVPRSGPGGEALRAAALYVLLSTMNHACSPNAKVAFDSCSTVTLSTSRVVEAGEALTLGYVTGDLLLVERRAKLQHWFFHCDCLQCETEERVAGALSSIGASAGLA